MRIQRTQGSTVASTGVPRHCWIVVPVRDRVGLTRHCLDAVVAAPPAVEFGVLVVDDGSTTPAREELAAHSDHCHFLVRETSGGFATACNDGAAATAGEYLVFLNNDTVPQPGWLDALVRYADHHPAAAVVGCRLLFPNDTIQHAGVVICQDGLPRHIYAGFAAEHPAAMRSRRFRAVTAACILIRRDVFEVAGGFDLAFHNGLEDIDLCLRIEELGHEVHYCHESVVYHLESASRERGKKDMAANVRLFRERWHGRTRPDELDVYTEDGLLRFDHEGTYPIHLSIAPELATINERDREVDRLVSDLACRLEEMLREVTRLTAYWADHGFRPSIPMARSAETRLPPDDREPDRAALETILRRAENIELQIHGLQVAASALTTNGDVPPAAVPFRESPVLAYRRLVHEVRGAVRTSIPEGATVLVVSNGDDDLVRLDGRVGRHFPQDATGTYLGYHPADSEAAIRYLEDLRAEGADYLVVPSTAVWWLTHYEAFARHLHEEYSVVSNDDTGLIFSLLEQRSNEGAAELLTGLEER